MRASRLKLDHGQRQISYTIGHRKSVTRRLHLRTAEDGSLLVIAPRWMREKDIHEALQGRVERVAAFLLRARARQKETPQYRYVDGELHLYLGRAFPLALQQGPSRTAAVEFDGQRFLVRGGGQAPHNVQSRLERWYRERSLNYLTGRTKVLAGSAPWVDQATIELRVRKMKRTWGSCSARGRLTFNTRLIKAPADCVDYVIAHELCHLRHMNHGPAFYELQNGLFPRWREIKAELQGKAHLYLAG